MKKLIKIVSEFAKRIMIVSIQNRLTIHQIRGYNEGLRAVTIYENAPFSACFR